MPASFRHIHNNLRNSFRPAHGSFPSSYYAYLTFCLRDYRPKYDPIHDRLCLFPSETVLHYDLHHETLTQRIYPSRYAKASRLIGCIHRPFQYNIIDLEFAAMVFRASMTGGDAYDDSHQRLILDAGLLGYFNTTHRVAKYLMLVTRTTAHSR